MYNNGDKAKQHIPYNRSVYFRENACNCIPNCAYETLLHFEKFPNGVILRIYESDNKQHKRAVLFKTSSCVTGFCGVLFESKTGLVLWGETNPADRNKGNYKQLKTMVYLLFKTKLWSQFQTEELKKAAGIV